MPFYEFTNGVEIKQIRAPMTEIDSITSALKAEGFRRVYTMPALHVYPVSFSEALEWAEKDTAREQQDWATRSEGMFREAVSQVSKADLDGFVSGEEIDL